MLSRWIFYLLLLIGAVFLTAFFETWLTGFILALTLALPLLSLVLSLPIMLGMSVCLLPPGQTVTYGARIRFWSVCFRNRFPLSVARVRMHVHIQNLMTGAEETRYVILYGPEFNSIWCAIIDTLCCGMLEARITRLQIYDYLGLFRLNRKPPPPVRVPVPPREMEAETPPRQPGCVSTPSPRPGGGPGEEYEIRPYRPGDPVKMIHWKLSCKRDETILRETLETRSAEPLLIFDHFGSQERLNEVLARLNAISKGLIAEGRPHSIRWLEQRNGRLHCWRITGERDLERCIAAILTCPAPPEGVPTPGDGTPDQLCCHVTAGEDP